MKKRNTTNPTNTAYPQLSKKATLLSQRRAGRILLLTIFLFTNGCFSIFKATPILEENKADALKNDNRFILLDENLNPIEKPDFSSLDKKIRALQKAKSFHDLNNLAVYGAKLSYIESSEEILKKLQKEKPNEMAPFLNLLRIYYLLDEYEIAKNMLNEYYKAHLGDKNKVFEFMKSLKASNRAEEHVLFLDVISNYQEHETQALEELGLYFLSIRDYELAKPYFEKILTIYAYHPVALHSMMQIHFVNESWANVISFGTPLKKEKKKANDYYAMMAKSYYELGEYSQAIKLSEEAPEAEKSSIDFLIVWRDSILCNDIKGSISNLNKYFQMAKKKDPYLKEEEFFLLNSKEGKRILSNFINGY